MPRTRIASDDLFKQGKDLEIKQGKGGTARRNGGVESLSKRKLEKRNQKQRENREKQSNK